MATVLPPASNQWRKESNQVFDEEVAFQPRFCDPESGLPLYQLTSEPVVSTNIYPEVPVSTPDGRFFVFARRLPLSRQPQYWLGDTELLTVRQVTAEERPSEPILDPGGSGFYYLDGDTLMRLRLDDYRREICFRLPAGVAPLGGLRAFDHSGRYAAFAARTETAPVGVALLDLQTGEAEIIYAHSEALNPHPQISRHPHSMLLVQVNHGIRFDAEGNLLALVGENGAALVACNLDGSGLAQLQVGFSPLERVQGHQCWVGRENQVITTLHHRETTESPWVQDRIAVIAPGEPEAHIVGQGPGFTHIHTDPDGQFWISDCNRSGDIFLGSIQTGKFKRLCRSGATFGCPQETHPHPFFIGRRDRVGWNSDRSGIPQIYCTRIPESFFDSLLEAG